jgi:hypothetical protein
MADLTPSEDSVTGNSGTCRPLSLRETTAAKAGSRGWVLGDSAVSGCARGSCYTLVSLQARGGEGAVLLRSRRQGGREAREAERQRGREAGSGPQDGRHRAAAIISCGRNEHSQPRVCLVHSQPRVCLVHSQPRVCLVHRATLQHSLAASTHAERSSTAAARPHVARAAQQQHSSSTASRHKGSPRHLQTVLRRSSVALAELTVRLSTLSLPLTNRYWKDCR